MLQKVHQHRKVYNRGIHSPKTRAAGIKIRAIHTLETITANSRVAKITCRIMHDRFACCLNCRRRSCGRGRRSGGRVACTIRLPLSIPTEHRVHDHPARFFDIQKLVERVVALRGAGVNARSAEIIICRKVCLLSCQIRRLRTHWNNRDTCALRPRLCRYTSRSTRLGE